VGICTSPALLLRFIRAEMHLQAVSGRAVGIGTSSALPLGVTRESGGLSTAAALLLRFIRVEVPLQGV
jgi:hypothetical protein